MLTRSPTGPRCRSLSGLAMERTAVTVHDGVGGQEPDQPLGVAPLDGGEEPAGQLLALVPGRLEPGAAGLDVAAGPGRDLAAALLRPVEHPGDLGVAVAEHVVE